MKKRIILMGLLCYLSVDVIGQKNSEKEAIVSSLDKLTPAYAEAAKKIWGYAEPGYQETKSSALLQHKLKEAGFKVTAGVAGIPTAFVAAYGTEGPKVGILAEFDALPGLSQTDDPEKKEVIAGAAGHGCGHNLFGVGSVAAGIAVKDWLKSSGTKGSVTVFGTPAEEGGSGKVYMVRAGLFDDIDAVLHWHPSDRNLANATSSLANMSAKFRFHGISAHAAAAPDRGRSALDGVEAMDDMVNMMREHMPSEARIHYVITKGGEAPNVVPDFAEVYYYVRHPEMQMVKDLFARVVKAAQGAAMGTETTVDYEVTGGAFNLLPNETLAKIMYENLSEVGGVKYSEEEKAYADKIRTSFTGKLPSLDAAVLIQPYKVEKIREGGGGSTDVGDVSWAVPTAGVRIATFVPGTPGHSWQAVACGGTSIGTKGMMVAAKSMALSAYDIFKNPSVLKIAKDELEEKRGAGFKYEAMVGDRKPALDYRNK
ncbi:amidohydrolase [Dyadobacter frigoris]|uniref:Amidohydrolase n=1 Tax=Dyadobacter frigoris TaxID=2576211 RepID=A0A4U6CVZ4_9BACT|nr:amidohydrolase [Dyadobacter frigoris]TKT88852.1 amidohydrolase [Dyadobacter frigoris]GLU56042.1 amidohydrolase [Dyadobacter frigoris]